MGWDVPGSLVPCLHPGSLQGTPSWDDGVLGCLQPRVQNSRPLRTGSLGKLTGPPLRPFPGGAGGHGSFISGLGLLTVSKSLSVWEALSLCSPLWGGPALFPNGVLVPKLGFSRGESSSHSGGLSDPAVLAAASQLGSAQASSGPKRV